MKRTGLPVDEPSGRVSFPLGRRALLLGAPALWIAGRASSQPSSFPPALIEAIRHHLDHATGFRVKFRTGIYQVRQPATEAQAQDALRQIPERLAALSAQQRTWLLIHHPNADGHLRTWLFNSTGLMAEGETSELYSWLDGLRSALNVDARMATRAPILRAARTAPPPSPPSPPPLPEAAAVEEALAAAAQQIFPGAVGQVLAAEQGRLLVLSALDTGAAPLAAFPLAQNRRFVHNWASIVLPDIETLLDSRRVFDLHGVRLSDALVMGNPDLTGDPRYVWRPLPEAREEAREVASIMRISDSRLFLDREASRTRAVEVMAHPSTRLIYFASHAVANEVNPMDGSFIALTGGHLFGRDLRHQRFAHWGALHPLVVLSACQTALGKTFAGGAYGMSRAWILAGAAQVVSSLWNVDDAATRTIMTAFADELDIGATPEEALRSAQIRASTNFTDDPGAWASFAVMGEPAIRTIN
ncbi:MAG: hypothetical protein QOD42_352 [Sphingomonadales bacterium]|jgi:hypothetical protein|nr:hypothetical protein [Sphingomonadales bacterium]